MNDERCGATAEDVPGLPETWQRPSAIGIAVGIIMVHFDLGCDDALRYLIDMSKATDQQLSDVARTVVDCGAPAGATLPLAVAEAVDQGTGVARRRTAPTTALPRARVSNHPTMKDQSSHDEDRQVMAVPSARAAPEQFSRGLGDSVPARLLDLLGVSGDLADVLRVVASLATESVPGCASASITVINQQGPVTIGSSDARALRIDQAQYREYRGPCVEAAYTNDVICIADVAATPVGPAWRRVALAQDITATLSVPIASAANIAAALNLYTTAVAGWVPRTLVAADALACCAGETITLLYRLTRHDLEGRHLWARLR
jgi:hypothetical protein